MTSRERNQYCEDSQTRRESKRADGVRVERFQYPYSLGLGAIEKPSLKELRDEEKAELETTDPQNKEGV
jgi:hypothetical protein